MIRIGWKKEAIVSVHYVKGELKRADIINIFLWFQEKHK